MAAQLLNIFPRPISPGSGLVRFILVAGAHVLLLIGLLHLSQTPVWQLQLRPLMVTLINPVQPAAHQQAASPQPAPRRAATAVAQPTLRSPEDPLHLAQPVPTAPATPVQPQQAWVPSDKPDITTPPTRQAMSTPPERKPLLATAASYQTAPPAEVPRLSKRAGESGTVWLRVRVDPAGLPVQVQLHRSSGYARLDEQALWAMRQARFKPHTEDGRAVEVEVIAPIEYPAD